VKLAVPGADGVPLRTPAELSVRPDGTAPLLVIQVYGLVPPLAANVTTYGDPAIPAGSGEVVLIVKAGAPIVRLNALDFFCPAESWTCTEKFDVPGVDGVPLRTPAEENVNPDGSAPAFSVQV
jgi:hypothetical protein